jgi:geranylgeranyl diphosphate synthase type II
MSVPTAPARADAVATDFLDWLDHSRAAVDAALAAHLNAIEVGLGPHSRLPAAVQYSVRLGGKRLRPILVLQSCRVCGGEVERAMPAALAVECVHTFSLIHDDLPAMDNDDLRRGQPTNHKVFGEGLAILAGDWLATHAFSLLEATHVAPALIAALARATERMIEGQAADIESEGRPADGELVRYIHERKTAALIEACCRLGALCAEAPDETVAALARYGQHLGLAFQIVDDVLDASGAAEKLGKGVRKDATAAKQTYPAAFGLAESRIQAGREIEAALQELGSFGSPADRLRDLARYVSRRDH